VLGVIALAAVGLAAADVATYAQLRSFIVQRTDESLQDSHFGLEHSCSQGDRGPPGGSSADFVQVRRADGAVICTRPLGGGFSNTFLSPPRLPASITLPPGGGGPSEPTRYFTVSAEDGGSRYRVRTSRDHDGQILVTARSLADMDATLSRLLMIELLVTGAVLAALAGLGLWVVRLGLRPLDAIGETAATIAAGDLSRRVERADTRTEVGRLGLALNAMLAQIQTAFEATEASEQRLRRFVADASHELRTPLSAVRAYAELFARGADRRPEDLARSMSGIERESKRMSVLVDDLLLLARLDEGRPLEREPVALEEVVTEAVDTALTLDPERAITLETEVTPVSGDRDRLRQIVDNLLANVRAHTPPEAPVRVRVSRVNGDAVIEVRDSGPGITDEQAERVFERFYRADISRSRARGGVGLGLSIVAAVAAAHGGLATVESEAGHGTKFRIALPLAATGAETLAASHTGS
jgi:two-component system, OmpR family, sensor kinase